MKEIIICAAIRHPHVETLIIRGHRHSDCLFSLWTKGYTKHEAVLFNQGFITSTNRFVDRNEAYDIQIKAGISSKCHNGYKKGTLYSEDLY